MRFEVKTDQNSILDKLPLAVYILMFTFLAVNLTNISMNLNNISRSNEIYYFCKLILVDKSPKNFKKLSKLTKQFNKQKVWDFCREFTK